MSHKVSLDAIRKTPKDDTTASMRSKIEVLEALLDREKDATGDFKGIIEDLKKRLDRAEDRVTASISPEGRARGYGDGCSGAE